VFTIVDWEGVEMRNRGLFACLALSAMLALASGSGRGELGADRLKTETPFAGLEAAQRGERVRSAQARDGAKQKDERGDAGRSRDDKFAQSVEDKFYQLSQCAGRLASAHERRAASDSIIAMQGWMKEVRDAVCIKGLADVALGQKYLAIVESRAFDLQMRFNNHTDCLLAAKDIYESLNSVSLEAKRRAKTGINMSNCEAINVDTCFHKSQRYRVTSESGANIRMTPFVMLEHEIVGVVAWKSWVTVLDEYKQWVEVTTTARRKGEEKPQIMKGWVHRHLLQGGRSCKEG